MDIKNIYHIAQRAMGAQLVRLNATASNLANADNIAQNPQDAYRPVKPVFETKYFDLINLMAFTGNPMTFFILVILSSLIAAIILFFMGSGPIKGFSITLGIGILTTLFSVYFIARMITAIYLIKNKNKENII